MDTWAAIPGVAPPRVEWVVCGDCRRAYRRGEHRAVWVAREEGGGEELVELCPLYLGEW